MANFLKKYRYDILIITILIFFSLLAFCSQDVFDVFSSREVLRSYLMSLGGLAPIIFVLFVIVEVVIAPIPGFIPAITAGFIFGPALGSLYTYIGSIIGSLIVFFIARKFGRPIIVKMFNEKRLVKYEKAISRQENMLLVFYFFPFFPLDVITAVFGLSAVKTKKFIIVVLIGYIFYVVSLNLFGDYLARMYF